MIVFVLVLLSCCSFCIILKVLVILFLIEVFRLFGLWKLIISLLLFNWVFVRMLLKVNRVFLLKNMWVIFLNRYLIMIFGNGRLFSWYWLNFSLFLRFGISIYCVFKYIVLGIVVMLVVINIFMVLLLSFSCMVGMV